MQLGVRIAVVILLFWSVNTLVPAQTVAESTPVDPKAPAAESSAKPAAKEPPAEAATGPDKKPAPEKPAEKPELGPENARFNKIFAEWKELLARLRALYEEYVVADSARRSAIEKEYGKLIAEGKEMEPKVVAAAEGAYAEAPNGNPELGEFLLAMLFNDIKQDNYDQALHLGKLLLAHDCPNKNVSNWTGYAAFVLGDFKAAADYFKQAQADKTFKPLKKDLLDNLVMQFTNDPEPFKTAWEKEQKIREAEAKADDLPRVLLKTTKGDITLELFENEAPNTVANFISLVEKGYYDGLVFHRVLDGFMAQGGCPKGDGTGGPGYTIPDECNGPNYRRHFRGSLSMAKTAAPDSGGSQFFLTFVPTPHLDGKHTVFGRVIDGMDVLSKLRRIDPNNPGTAEPDKIIEAKVLRKRAHPYVPKTIAEDE